MSSYILSLLILLEFDHVLFIENDVRKNILRKMTFEKTFYKKWKREKEKTFYKKNDYIFNWLEKYFQLINYFSQKNFRKCGKHFSKSQWTKRILMHNLPLKTPFLANCKELVRKGNLQRVILCKCRMKCQSKTLSQSIWFKQLFFG